MRYLKSLCLSVLSFVVAVSQADAATRIYQANAGAVPQIQGQDLNQNDRLTPKAKSSDNVFLQYYAMQGNEFSATVFQLENGALAKRDISYDSLQKAVVMFFGDWCPHCHEFLTNFAKHVSKLTARGINVILLNVPSIDRLKNWQDPTIQDYQAALQKIQSYGITMSTNVKLVLLGDKATLSKTGVSGLPVFIAIKDAAEHFRGVGKQGVSKLQLSDTNVLNQFLAIWDDVAEENVSGDIALKQTSPQPQTSHKKSQGGRTTDKKAKKSTKSSSKKSKKTPITKLTKEALVESKTATEMLNSMFWKTDLNRVR